MISDLEKLIYDVEYEKWKTWNTPQSSRIKAMQAFLGDKNPKDLEDSLFYLFLQEKRNSLRR